MGKGGGKGAGKGHGKGSSGGGDVDLTPGGTPYLEQTLLDIINARVGWRKLIVRPFVPSTETRHAAAGLVVSRSFWASSLKSFSRGAVRYRWTPAPTPSHAPTPTPALPLRGGRETAGCTPGLRFAG